LRGSLHYSVRSISSKFRNFFNNLVLKLYFSNIEIKWNSIEEKKNFLFGFLKNNSELSIKL